MRLELASGVSQRFTSVVRRPTTFVYIHVGVGVDFAHLCCLISQIDRAIKVVFAMELFK